MIRFFIAILFVVMSLSAFAETEMLGERERKTGFTIGYGFQNGLNVNYHYDVLLFQFNYYITILKNASLSVEIIPKPQFNITRYKVTNNSLKEESGFELGLNVGFAVRKYLHEGNTAVYLLVGSGPHYVSGVPERQANGFIFSDNFMTGLDTKLSGRLRLDISAGIRHISNAGLKRPNGGVNNIILNTGLIYILD